MSRGIFHRGLARTSGDLLKRPLIGSGLIEVLRGDLVKSSCNRDISKSKRSLVEAL